MTTIEEALRKEIAILREQHSNVLRENECQRQELADMKRADWKVAHIKDLEGQLTERRDRVDDLDKELAASRKWNQAWRIEMTWKDKAAP